LKVVTDERDGRFVEAALNDRQATHEVEQGHTNARGRLHPKFSSEESIMNWQEVCADPHLQDLPYKIELNERGQILMTPVRLCHSAFQGKIIKLLIRLLPCGEAFPEFAIATEKGTKVADVVWCSDGLWQQIKHLAESAVAPELCVEVLSPANTAEEMQEKRELYFQRGAEEVWICEQEGAMRFFVAAGEIAQSKLAPAFPKQIAL
jgi:Uma2 family endonuclease